MTKSKFRLVAGVFSLLLVIIVNRWTLIFFSPDGSFETLTTIAIWTFDIFLVLTGLIILYADRDTIINIILFAAVLLISLIPLDMVLRPLLKDKLYYRPEGIYKNRWPPLPSLLRYDKNIHYKDSNCGDLAVISHNNEARQFREITFTTDSYGFRNSGFDSTRAIDLIMLGDSFGAAVGTPQEKSWCSLLHSKYGFQTYNLSVDGVDPWQEYMNLKIELKRLRVKSGTKVLWAIFTGNDLENPEGHDPDSYRYRNWGERKMVSISTYFRRSPIKLIVERILTGFNADSTAYKVVERDFLDHKKVLFSLYFDNAQKRTHDLVTEHPDFNVYTAVFDSMQVLSQSNNLDVIVIMIPSKEEVYSWLLNNETPWTSSKDPSAFSTITGDLCKKHGFSFFDLKAGLIDSSKQAYLENGELLWWYDDIHWNEIGNRVAASLVNSEIAGLRDNNESN